MSLFYKKPNEEKPKPTDLETAMQILLEANDRIQESIQNQRQMDETHLKELFEERLKQIAEGHQVAFIGCTLSAQQKERAYEAILTAITKKQDEVMRKYLYYYNTLIATR